MQYSVIETHYLGDKAKVEIILETESEKYKVNGKVDKEARGAAWASLSETQRKEKIRVLKEQLAERREIQKEEILSANEKSTYTKAGLQKVLDKIEEGNKKFGIKNDVQKPILTGVSSDERKERRNLYNEYAPKYADFILRTMQSNIAVDLLDNGKDLQRQTKTLISAKDPDKVEETLKNFDLVR
ncbi:MAG: hypothetical protein MJ072_05785, partial [Clostridia bacterium]|nr:hypothetical protein [Clostridia bacterium]